MLLIDQTESDDKNNFIKELEGTDVTNVSTIATAEKKLKRQRYNTIVYCLNDKISKLDVKKDVSKLSSLKKKALLVVIIREKNFNHYCEVALKAGAGLVTTYKFLTSLIRELKI